MHTGGIATFMLAAAARGWSGLALVKCDTKITFRSATATHTWPAGVGSVCLCILERGGKGARKTRISNEFMTAFCLAAGVFHIFTRLITNSRGFWWMLQMGYDGVTQELTGMVGCFFFRLFFMCSLRKD